MRREVGCFFFTTKLISICLYFFFFTNISRIFHADFLLMKFSQKKKKGKKKKKKKRYNTALLRLLKTKFHGTVLCLISLNDLLDRVYVFVR